MPKKFKNFRIETSILQVEHGVYPTVKSQIVVAATINFQTLQVRRLIESGSYLSAATITSK